ncbi:tannase/feruloyl esterase family alpha/beta hydrolase [Sphingomonas piscis]|uniref:Tannase/feruloyl esterase family alpha/beta hydrolase n=1 Tax=Sphingomonas piscis TaxID=2714943 RepID=A0A6G7YM52_9SPHN|nr:tannase/feruloyl esterase family alpha/beta hydrolase [Sphingomonas piscis]QIK77819.1 tannase/feruloyl esterase family alpha/beta hydrolase [Sphingomonas piscis]
MLSLGLAVAAGALNCAALAGPHSRTVVVQAATTVRPSPSWRIEGNGPYRAEPVQVPFCRVQGTIEGNIGFELWLPADWNGRLLGAGVGGDAGVFNYRDMAFRLPEGFATVTTDAGHKATQKRWMADAKARVDYEHRAVHLTAQVAKSLIARYYGKAANRSYFLGCSGGGRQALKEMQNYPADYDGVIAGAPGPYMPLISVRMMWFALQQKHNPAGALSDADWSLYERRATAACDRNDGVADGVIENPLVCRFDKATLLCKPGQFANCLPAPKLAMLNQIVSPMRDEQGRPMDKGLLPGVRTRPGPPSPLLRAMWADAVYNDPNWNEETFRRTADLAAANRIMPELRADKVAIAPFIRRGGKAIFYQGWADPSVIAGPTIDYYARLARANGGYDSISRSVRLFMAPGMYHCGGGPGADTFGGSGHTPLPGRKEDGDTLWSLIRWVERNEAPELLVATKLEGSSVRFTRKLCAFPRVAVYRGSGDVTAATSFYCRVDPQLAGRMQQSD